VSNGVPGHVSVEEVASQSGEVGERRRGGGWKGTNMEPREEVIQGGHNGRERRGVQ
jgi:hypothetical protein